MAIYRNTRNFEASVIDFLNGIFEQSGGYSNITVEKTFKRIYGLQMDINTGAAAVCVRALGSDLPKVELGSNAIQRTVTIMIDIFATSDGQREDLKDYIIYYIKRGVPYFQYQTSGATITSKVQCGYLRVMRIDDTPVNFNVDKNQLQVADRYRHALAIKMTTGMIEE
jgi:hypothetical protein